MKLIFLGTPDIAAFILEQMIANNYIPELVVTKEDAPAGRGMKLQPSAVKQVALKHNIHVAQASSLKKNPDVVAQMKAIDPDYIIVVAYGCILSQEVLSIPKSKCINVHASLLPKWRGAAPIQRSLLAGDKVTGVTIMEMDIGLDTGDMLLQEKVAIDKFETHGSLYEKIKIAGSKALINYLDNFTTIASTAQSEDEVTYAEKIQKSEALIDFSKTATEVDLHIRGFNPPGAYTNLDGILYKIWSAEVINFNNKQHIVDESTIVAGTIVQADKHGLIVKCGYDDTMPTFLKVNLLQIAGKPKQNYTFIVSSHNMLGKIFGFQI